CRCHHGRPGVYPLEGTVLPPYSNTGVSLPGRDKKMKISLKVDWLTLTGKSSWEAVGALSPSLPAAKQLAVQLLDRVTDGNAVVKGDSPLPHSSCVFRDAHSALHVAVGKDLRVKGGLQKAPGKALSEPPRENKLMYTAGQQGWNCPRLDF